MYVQPNTTIRLLHNCPLEPNYEHTIWFDTRMEQESYFSSLTKFVIPDSQYTRCGKGMIRVPWNAEKLYDCNYLMFQNASFTNVDGTSKWFYAFIDSVDYVSNDVSEIRFTIDVMQTWLFDCEPDYCFVEREHSVTDGIGENTIPENLETGPYVTTAYKEQLFGKEGFVYDILLASNRYPNAESDSPVAVTGGPTKILGYPNTCYYKRCNSIDEVSSYIATIDKTFFADTNNIVIGVFAVPTELADVNPNVGRSSIIAPPRTLSYSPKNNKLYTSPYCKLVITGEGTAKEYPYELLGDSYLFKWIYSYAPTNGAIMYPSSYKGVPDDVNSSVSVGKFSSLPWTNNAFQNWLSNNVLQLGGAVMGGLALGAVGGGLAAASVGAVGGTGLAVQGTVAAVNTVGLAQGAAISNQGAEQVNGVLKNVLQHSAAPIDFHGTLDAGSLAEIAGLKGFRMYCKSIRPEYIRVIDDYFSKYGYATHRVKIPNRNSRPYWNYVKTVGATLNGSIPADDERAICSIYDRGITFWKNGNDVGNYSLNNSVGGTELAAPIAVTPIVETQAASEE